MDDNVGARRPTVSCELHAADTAIVTLVGEHDLKSKVELGAALENASAQRFVLVDLSACTFIDSTVLALIVATCQRVWERDGQVELVIPSRAAEVHRILNLAGLTTFLTIRETRDEALASLRRDG
jgi:anti-anti-sigma factor